MKRRTLLWLTTWVVTGATFAVLDEHSAAAQENGLGTGRVNSMLSNVSGNSSNVYNANNAARAANNAARLNNQTKGNNTSRLNNASRPNNSTRTNNAVNTNNVAAEPKSNLANNSLNNAQNSAKLNANNTASQAVNAIRNNAKPVPKNNASAPKNNSTPANTSPINIAPSLNSSTYNGTGRTSQTFGTSATQNPSVMQSGSAPGGENRQGYSQTGERVRRAASRDAELAAYEDQVTNDLRALLKKDLENYCLNYCNIMSVDTIAEEVFDTANADLGFEGSNSVSAPVRKFRTLSVNAEVLVDTRFGSENIDRVRKLFEKLAARYGKPTNLSWSQVTFPETAATQKSEAQVRGEFASQVRNRIERLISEFCPSECKLNSLDVHVSRATMDEAERGSVQRFLFANDGRGALFVNGVQIGVSINSDMSPIRRSQIVSLVRESLLPFGSVSMDVDSVPFPTPASELQKDRDDERRDPYNIEKIGALLKLFRENLVSKEVIKETNNSMSQERERESRERAENRENSSALQREKETGSTLRERDRESSMREGTEREVNSESSYDDSGTGTLGWLSAGVLLLLLCVVAVALWMRKTLASQQMREALEEGTNPEGTISHETGNGENSEPVGENEDGKLIRSRLESDELMREIRQIFVSQPKVAREVFTRILHEDGVESTAKYVVIFGEIVIYELLCDSDLKADLNALAEVMHKNAPKVEDTEKTELLRQLKMKLTAGKMRLLTNKTLDAFDFLKAWAPRQLFELVQDENSQVQGIVLTQLPPEKRRAVFDLFSDNYKTILMQELSRIDLAPREYLIGTAENLRAKSQRNPMFDAENVRGSDVLLDLLTTSNYAQQQSLIGQLDASNPEAAWRVRNSLVTADTMVGMPNGLLIELFLDFEPQEIGLFLSRTRPNVRDTILSRAPREIAGNWADFMSNLGEVEGISYQAVEQRVLSKIRQYASKGKISLAEINARLYPRGGNMSETASQERATRIQDSNASAFSIPPNMGKPNRVA